jgi:hypothetical protein
VAAGASSHGSEGSPQAQGATVMLGSPLCYALVVQILDLATKWLLRTKANDVKGLLRLHGVVTTFLKMHKKTLRRADIRWAFICFAVDTYSAKENHLYQTH